MVFQAVYLLSVMMGGVGMMVGAYMWVQVDTTIPHQLDQVAPVQAATLKADAWILRSRTAEERCIYHGLIVPYEKLWEERSNPWGVESVSPPEPGKIAELAYVFNKKVCDDGQSIEPVLRVATGLYRTTMGDIMPQGVPLTTYALSAAEEDHPKWLPQVLERIAQAADTNPAAKEFLQFTEESARKLAEAQGAQETAPKVEPAEANTAEESAQDVTASESGEAVAESPPLGTGSEDGEQIAAVQEPVGEPVAEVATD